ncbi:methyltransferase [Pectobacterium carotovorum]|uniref:O-methyltransferase C-terminal domain-containing protein n=2 Tax=Pectobacterium carotovorum TaxID=554 RepID=A0AAI9L1U0_PECCC|nr:methyltransferase [Pectobacterium carotovorum]GKW07716.1 hypothetical protein PEC301889_21990 [Pectobacterium carotovorum subsp. carotovorum]GKX48915.1 hypothetical protein SOASR016_36670 [Pectobacterium carotovorum subsp. carotovorum]GLV71408.1 hypothetical protein Pcaca03_38520 [Pectobacterium carotovorum subsp. carotovorum]
MMMPLAAKALCVAAEIGIADKIGEQGTTIAELAKECQASEKNISNIIKVLEIFGLTLYEHLAHSESRAEIYDLAMRDLSRPVGYVLVKEYASLFKTVGSVVDIGGGSGGAGLNTMGALFFYFFLMLT